MAYTYLTCSDTDNTAFASDRIYGLNPFWVNLFNVHKCSNATSTTKVIPLLAFYTTASGNYTFQKYAQYDFNSDDLKSGTPKLSNITCLDITSKTTIKTTLSLPNTVDDEKVDEMANCGLAILNFNEFDTRTNFDNTAYSIATVTDRSGKQDLECVACAPGYKSDPGFADNTEKVVRKCTAIANCDLTQNQTIFNGCSKCKANYTWSSDNSGIVDYGACVQIPATLTNCLAYYNNGSGSKGECKFCDRGYTKTRDGYCEKVTVSSCSSQWFPDAPAGSLSIINYIAKDGLGCSQCDANYIQVKKTLNVCGAIGSLTNSVDKNLTNVTVINGTQTRGAGNFIDRCVSYLVGSTNCNACYTNYILTQD